MKGKGFRSKLLRKYRLTIHNENKLENVLGFYISPLWAIITLFFSFLLVAGVIFLIITFTPVGNLIPGYVSESTKEKLISYNLRIDSLTREVAKQDRYLANIRAIMNGEITLDSIKNSPEQISSDSFPVTRSENEERFATEWENRERYNLISQATNVASLQELNLFRPTQGEVITPFDEAGGHFGVDIAEIPGESVLAIHGGTVVMSDCLQFVQRDMGQYDLIFADPPYCKAIGDRDMIAELMNDRLHELLAPDGYFIAEAQLGYGVGDSHCRDFPGWQLVDTRSYGGNTILFYRKSD